MAVSRHAERLTTMGKMDTVQQIYLHHPNAFLVRYKRYFVPCDVRCC